MRFRFGTASCYEIDAEELFIEKEEFLQKLNAQIETIPISGTEITYKAITIDVNSLDDLEELLNRFDILVMCKEGYGLVYKYPEIIWADAPIMYQTMYNQNDEYGE